MVGEEVLPVHDEAFFGVEIVLDGGPGDGEGMICPETYRGQGEIHVLAGPEGPRAGHLDGDAEGVGGKGFDNCDGAAMTKVTVHDSTNTDKAL